MDGEQLPMSGDIMLTLEDRSNSLEVNIQLADIIGGLTDSDSLR